MKVRVLIQAVKRNKERFPDDFMFQLTRMETEYLELNNIEDLRVLFIPLGNTSFLTG